MVLTICLTCEYNKKRLEIMNLILYQSSVLELWSEHIKKSLENLAPNDFLAYILVKCRILHKRNTADLKKHHA